jgi:hypothetical protein
MTRSRMSDLAKLPETQQRFPSLQPFVILAEQADNRGVRNVRHNDVWCRSRAIKNISGQSPTQNVPVLLDYTT